jgi:hypothetical protein
MRVHTGKMEAWAAGLWDTVQNFRKKIDRVYDREQQCPFIERVSGWGAMCNEERA